MVIQYCSPPITGAVARDPDDDKIIACAAAAGAEYLVSRDRDLLTLGRYGEIKIVSPEALLRIVRSFSPDS
jgi:predicted nucleic acid-binding protein